MLADLIHREATASDRRAGTLSSELAWHAARAGDALVALIARSGDLAPVFDSVRHLAQDTKLRLVVPRELADALQRGEWHLVAAGDGSGFLPTVQDAEGLFVKQVRLIEERLPANPAQVTNAVAHARTHAMLREILEKLEAIDKKLDLVLAHQRNDSVGKVISGMRTFKALAGEPGDDTSRTALLANALQSLQEGQSTLLLDLSSRLEAQRIKPPWWEPSWSPSEKRARWLDRHAEDLEWLYGAASTIAAIHAMQSRPLAARETMSHFSEALTPVRGSLEALYQYSRYTPERGSFWSDRFPLLASRLALANEPADLVFETTPHELCALCEPPATGGTT